MQPLQTFIDMLTKGRKIHISILDIDGILNTSLTRISTQNTMHTKKFCDLAKSTEKGFRLCLSCKALANRKAKKGKKPFFGHCPWGLYEAAVPVVRGEAVSAIIYVGNYITDDKKSRKLIEHTCMLTGVDSSSLYRQLDECEYTDDIDEAYRIGEMVRDYLLLISKKRVPRLSELHWLTLKLKNYADEFYLTDISLKNLAKSYSKNEKYMGRLFKKEMGIGFNEYCVSLRMKRAEERLLNSTDKIIDVALDCGFNNISYFNRIFKKEYGVSPTEYRRMCRP